jgi:hypothetical protein
LLGLVDLGVFPAIEAAVWQSNLLTGDTGTADPRYGSIDQSKGILRICDVPEDDGIGSHLTGSYVADFIVPGLRKRQGEPYRSQVAESFTPYGYRQIILSSGFRALRRSERFCNHRSDRACGFCGIL